MNNYEYANVFEKLAIKIVEAKCGYELDNQKSGVTQKTRDYGVDAVISFANENFKFSTIEAKLRKSSCTLALKDIASSILFFLVRNGNEHFIISNVYMTFGTIQTINLLNLQSSSQLRYIAGEETFKILEKIVDKLENPKEKELAQLLIEKFPKYKKPQTKQVQTNVSPKLIDGCADKKLFASRQVFIDYIIEGIHKGYHLFPLYGEKNIGKTFLLKSLNEVLINNGYKIIMIDVYKYNTIDVFCYELAKKMLEIDLEEIIHSLSQNQIESLEHILTDSEKETLTIFEYIFHSEKLQDITAAYLAEKYLQTLFHKCDSIRYIIELENVSYTSKEIFEFIKKFSSEMPSNVHVICEFSYDLSAYYQDFSHQYKEIYFSNIRETKIMGISREECKTCLKESLPYIDDQLTEHIFQFSKGNPVSIDRLINLLNEEVLINEDIITNKILLIQQGHYQEIEEFMSSDILITKFFLLQYIFSFSLKKTIWKMVLKKEEKCIESNSKLTSIILNSDLFEMNNESYMCRDFYFLNKMEEYLEENSILYLTISKSLQQYLFTMCQKEFSALAEIRLLFLADDCTIIDKYESKKNLWMYKSNITWQKQSLKLICRFYLRNSMNEDDISKHLKGIHYYLNYLEIITFMGTFEKNLHKKILEYKEIFEEEYSNISESLRCRMAEVLADIYIYKYQFYRRTSSFEKEIELLEKCILKEWFPHISELKKIKIFRYQALSYKSVGKRKIYDDKLKKIYDTYKSNSYASLIYWANKAAPFYINSPRTALNYLKKCDLEKFLEEYPQEIKLYLWVKNDLSIVLFYNHELMRAREISEYVLQKSSKINYNENIARAHNILGAIALKEKDIELARTEFFKAFSICVDISGEAFFHFSVNYLVTAQNYEEKLVMLIKKYLESNKKRLIKIFQTQQLDICRWFTTLYAFYSYLKKHNPALSKEVEFLFSPFLSETPHSLLENYIICDNLIVLF